MQEQMCLDATARSDVNVSSNHDNESSIDPQLVIIRSVLEQDKASPAVVATPRTKTNKAPRKAFRAAFSRVLRPVSSIVRRPDMPRYLAVLLLGYLAVFHTGTVVFIACMTMLLGLVLYFSFGPDRVRDWAVARYIRLRNRNPKAAERLRCRAAKASHAVGSVVDRMPERWTTGLYLPDFDEPDEGSERWKADPFERLAREK